MYYKVVKQEKGRYYSSSLKGTVWMMEYKIGKWVKPQIGQIFIFDNFKKAKQFAKISQEMFFKVRMSIFEIEVKSKVKKLNKIYFPLWDDIRLWEKLWKFEKDDEDFSELENAVFYKDFPDGTCMVKEIKLVKKI